MTAKNLTTHVFLLLDSSGSMSHLTSKTIQAADELIVHLAEQSKKMNQEWRVSVYTFDNDVTCHIWNMDVLRLPSMKEFYRIGGMTALVDAAFLALEDGDKITEHRGDHAFLTYLLTDGGENASKLDSKVGYGRLPKAEVARKMRERIAGLKENRTLAVLVPNDEGVRESQSFGFENILLWDASSEQGLEKATEAIKASATNYMTARTQGAAGLKTMRGGLFVGGDVTAKAIKAAHLTPLPSKDRRIVVVTKTDDAFQKVVKPVTKSRLKAEMGWFVEIEKFVNKAHPPYRVGMAYYELVKTERVQGDKEIAVVEVSTNKVFVGDGARQLLGLPDHVVSVKPNLNPDYKIYVQSTSLNRHLPIGSHVLLLTK